MVWLAPIAPASGATVPGGRPTAAVAATARAVSPVPAGARLRVTVTMRPRDPAALAAYARAVSTPGSADYHAYLTPRQFARRFGPTPSQVSLVRRSLQARGLHPGQVSAGGLSIPLLATAGALERGFRTSLRRLSFSGRRTAVAATSPLVLGAGSAGVVQSVVGLDGSPSPRPLLVRPAARLGRSAPPQPRVATGGAQPCASALGAAPSQSAYTDDQIASAYGFSGLYGAGDLAARVTVAIYELESDDPADIAAYQSCYGTHATVSYARVDGGAGTGAGPDGEAALDIENTIGLAPDVSVVVYQGPNNNGPGPYDLYQAIVSDDRARVVTVSWGDCEAALGQATAVAESKLFEEATVQGQTIVAASGDSGSEDCNGGGTLPEEQLAVDDPASQPFVTGVGGTSLPSLGPRPTESVWNNGGSLTGGLIEPGAGGGGVSSFWAMPPAQFDAASSLGVRSGGAGCDSPSGYCREVPDVAADADPNTGYLIYWNGGGSVSGQPTGWQGFGGTSAAAPVWAALLALADGSRACAGSPIGYADPALYRAAGRDYPDDFNDVVTGNDDFTGTNSGRYSAVAGYDRATGLGTPNAAALAGALCPDTTRVDDPGSQRSAVQSTVSLALHGHDAPANKLAYDAKGLPPGLMLNASSGKITGKLRRTGTFSVTVGAHDAAGSATARRFTWRIGSATRLSRVTLAARTPKLAFTLAAGRGSPAISTLRMTAPRGLRLVSARGVAVTTSSAPARRLRFGAHVTRGTLTIKLRQTAASLRVTLTRPGLQAPGRAAAVSRRGRAAPHLTVTVMDAGAGNSRLSATPLVSSR
jgi:subtilase family serine protease